jgi:HD superfamily phosphohydrolase
LIRDSYFTGVAEGVIGYDRIIKMLNVVDHHLVVEEKGIYSVEKFLVARRLMYWQVYLHKTVLAAEQMLISILKRAKKLIASNVKVSCSKNLYNFLSSDFSLTNKELIISDYIDAFAEIDDVDIMDLIKSNTKHSDFIFAFTSNCLLERKLFKIYLQDEVFKDHEKRVVLEGVEKHLNVSKELAKNLILEGRESNLSYNSKSEEIRILLKNGEVRPLSDFHTEFLRPRIVTKHYISFPQ